MSLLRCTLGRKVGSELNEWLNKWTVLWQGFKHRSAEGSAQYKRRKGVRGLAVLQRTMHNQCRTMRSPMCIEASWCTHVPRWRKVVVHTDWGKVSFAFSGQYHYFTIWKEWEEVGVASSQPLSLHWVKCSSKCGHYSYKYAGGKYFGSTCIESLWSFFRGSCQYPSPHFLRSF